MKNALIRWAVLTIAVWVAAFIIPGIEYTGWQSLLVASLVLGVLNVFVKPLLTIISLPFIFFTLGLFILIINALILMATGWLVEGFLVSSFWSALGGSLIISIINLFLSRESTVSSSNIRVHHEKPDSRKPPKGKGPIIDV